MNGQLGSTQLGSFVLGSGPSGRRARLVGGWVYPAPPSRKPLDDDEAIVLALVTRRRP